jgi:hypothetical protein
MSSQREVALNNNRKKIPMDKLCENVIWFPFISSFGLLYISKQFEVKRQANGVVLFRLAV